MIKSGGREPIFKLIDRNRWDTTEGKPRLEYVSLSRITPNIESDAYAKMMEKG